MALDKVAIGERLRNFGERKFGRISDFAKALNMTQGALQSGYLSGRSIPGGEFVAKLMEMGCDIYWLFYGDEINLIPKDDYPNVLSMEEIVSFPAGPQKQYLLSLHQKYYGIKSRYETYRSISSKYTDKSISLDRELEARLANIENDIKDLKVENYDLKKEIQRKNEELLNKNESIEALFTELGKNLLVLAQIEELRRKFNL